MVPFGNLNDVGYDSYTTGNVEVDVSKNAMAAVTICKPDSLRQEQKIYGKFDNREDRCVVDRHGGVLGAIKIVVQARLTLSRYKVEESRL